MAGCSVHKRVISNTILIINPDYLLICVESARADFRAGTLCVESGVEEVNIRR